MKRRRTHLAFFPFMWIAVLLNPVSTTTSALDPSLNADDASTKTLISRDSTNSIFDNLTALGAIDPAFGFAPIFSGERLRPVPCLLNAVNAALQLALDDFEGFMFETTFRLDSHPQVEIAVVPDEEGGTIPRKYVVWGLTIGIGKLSCGDLSSSVS